jgi:hypothetical protein
MQQPQVIEDLIDEREYARIRNCSVGTIRRERALGTGCPYIKIGAQVRYRPSSIREFLERSTRRAIAGVSVAERTEEAPAATAADAA